MTKHYQSKLELITSYYEKWKTNKHHFFKIFWTVEWTTNELQNQIKSIANTYVFSMQIGEELFIV